MAEWYFLSSGTKNLLEKEVSLERSYDADNVAREVIDNMGGFFFIQNFIPNSWEALEPYENDISLI